MLKKVYSAHSNLFFALLLIVLASFIFSLSSCSTTDTYTIKEPGTIKQEGVIIIEKVTLRDSTFYNFKKDEAVYKKKYKDTSEVIVLNSKKEISDSTIKKISRDKYLLFLKDLAVIKYQRTYISTTDAFLTAGIVVGGVVLLGYLILAIALTSRKLNITG